MDPSDRMDPLDRIDEVINIVEQARSVPMSRTNCMVERGEMIGMLEDLRAELPTDLRKAAALLEERDRIIDKGRSEAERIIAEGEAEHARLVSVNEITVSAEHEAPASSRRRGPRPSACVRRSTTTSTPRWPTSSSS